MTSIAAVRPQPWLSAGRLGLTAAASLAAAWIHQTHDPGALCPLRRITGVPCPFCGSTTVFMEAGAGHWAAALTANPLTVAAALVFLAAPAMGVDPVVTLQRVPARLRWTVAGVLALLSWLWQLSRYGFL